MLRIALVDGDLASRAGRRLMIDSQSNFQLVFEESDAKSALERIPELLVDVIVIDQRLKGFDGLQLCRGLVDAFCEKGEICPPLVVTGPYETSELLLAALRSGVSAVATQDSPMHELLSAINWSGESGIGDSYSKFSGLLVEQSQDSVPDSKFLMHRGLLGESQRQILNHLESGASVKDIQTKYGMSDSDFDNALRSLLIALRMATIDQLVLAVREAKSII